MKNTIKNRSLCLEKTNLIPFVFELALIARVISSIFITFCGSWKAKVFKVILGKNLIGTKSGACGTI